jgi:hypothetical protein
MIPLARSAIAKQAASSAAIAKLAASGLSVSEIENLIGDLLSATRGTEGDVLRGAEEISQFLYGRPDRERQVYELGRAGIITLFKMGNIRCARRSTLTAEIAALESAAARIRTENATGAR